MNKRKRSNGEGSVIERSDGRWMGRLTLRDGKVKTIYGKTKQEVLRKLTALKHDRDVGVPQRSDERMKLGVYLEQWLADKRSSVKPRTWIRYRELLAHVADVLGDQYLARITPFSLQGLYTTLQAEPPAGKGLSSSTVHHVHTVLHGALGAAERFGLIPRNPVALVKAPRMAQTEMRVLEVEQARALLEAARGDRLEALYVLALTTGMRQGELLALRWKDIDLDHATLQVRGTLYSIPSEGFRIGPPKTKQSRRRIELSTEAVAALRRHKTEQAKERLEKGPLWDCVTWPDLVFPNQLGRPLDATNLSKYYFHPLLQRANLPRIRFHDLRHTAATLMLLQDINPKVVSERLGHASIAITLDRYSHVLPSMQKEAAAALDRVLFTSDR